MIERKAEKKVKNWIARGNDALLITGARQIGKTYLIRECLEKSKIPYIELNFIEQPELVELFAGAKDTEDLLMRLSLVSSKKLEKGKIQQTYNRWRNVKSPASDKSLRAESIRHINRIFKAALNYAIEMEYIKKNPTNGVRIGKDLTNNRVEVYTTDEIKELKSVVKGTDMELSVALLFDCVMRRGELLGLAFEDIDFEKNIVKIRHSWVESEDSKKPVLKDCKTDGSYREMVVSEETMRLLKRQKVYCKTICLREGKPFTGKQRVICKEDGNPFLPKSYTSKWNKTLKKYGLRHIKLHGTRHSAISWFLSQGVPLHIVQARAGHQDPKITLSAYSHVAKDDASRVADLLDNTLFSAVNE